MIKIENSNAFGPNVKVYINIYSRRIKIAFVLHSLHYYDIAWMNWQCNTMNTTTTIEE